MKNFSARTVFTAILTMAAIGLIIAAEGFATLYKLAPAADAMVYSAAADTNYGTDTSLSVYRRMTYNLKQRSFLKFDLSVIAVRETISGATLNIYAYGFHTFGPLEPALY